MDVDSIVEISPHYDLWMMGDKFGKVVKTDLDKQKITVKMEITKKKFVFPVEDLTCRT